MVYRFHFTSHDLAGTRFAASVPPLTELNIAVRVLQDRRHQVRFGAWRHEVLRRLRPQARMVLDLTPVYGWSAGFLAPTGTGDVLELLERVAATPPREVQASLSRMAQERRLPSWARSLGEDSRVLEKLAEALGDVHAIAMAPYLPQIDTAIRADLALRGRDFIHGGIERILSGLYPPRIRWRPPVLEVDLVCGLEADDYLEGRGLLLVPSAFATQGPLIDPDTGPQPTLVYPACYQGAEGEPFAISPKSATAPGSISALGALVGQTRAAVLNTVAENPGCTTSELAMLASLSLSGASQHATVLREAGLLSTVRHRNTALHTATSAGIAMLEAAARSDA